MLLVFVPVLSRHRSVTTCVPDNGLSRRLSSVRVWFDWWRRERAAESRRKAGDALKRPCILLQPAAWTIKLSGMEKWLDNDG